MVIFMTVTHTYADVEQLLIGWIPTVVLARAVTETPDKMETVLPIIRVTRVGGPSLVGFDQPTIDIDCFAATRPAAKALAIQLHAAIEYQLPGFTNTYGTVIETQALSGPAWRPWDIAGPSGLRRFGALYRMIVHSRI